MRRSLSNSAKKPTTTAAAATAVGSKVRNASTSQFRPSITNTKGAKFDFTTTTTVTTVEKTGRNSLSVGVGNEDIFKGWQLFLFNAQQMNQSQLC